MRERDCSIGNYSYGSAEVHSPFTSQMILMIPVTMDHLRCEFILGGPENTRNASGL